MSNIDAQGNIHDESGRFSQKHNTAPGDGLRPSGGGESPYSLEFWVSEQIANDALRMLRTDAVREFERLAPSSASRIRLTRNGALGGHLTFTCFLDDEHEAMRPFDDTLEATDRLAGLFTLETASEHGFEPAGDGIVELDLTAVRSTGPDELLQRMHDATHRYHLAGYEVRPQADQLLHQAAVDYLAAAKPADVELHLGWSDQGDFLAIDTVMQGGVEIDAFDLDEYDSIDLAVSNLNAVEELVRDGHLEEAGRNRWRFVG